MLNDGQQGRAFPLAARGTPEGKTMRLRYTGSLRFLAHGALSALAMVLLVPREASAQGETTSSIVGQVTDSSDAVVPAAIVTVANRDIGLRRTVKTDQAGRFNFPQLKPGTYAIRVEAQGFEPQHADNVVSGLGQKQTVNFVLKVA